jgi:hypothetical protein
MDFCRWAAFTLFRQGLIHRFHGLDPIIPFLIGGGVENYETGLPFYGEHQGPMAPHIINARSALRLTASLN